MSYYSDDEDLDVHIRRHHSPPDRYRYVPTAPPPRRQYYDPGPSYLVPEQRTTVVARSKSRDRSRSRGSPPQAAGPVIINNRIYNEHSDDEDDYHGRRQISRSRSRSRSEAYMSREEWEAINDRRELERIKSARARDDEERRLQKELKDDAELQRAKRELDEIKDREARHEQEKRIKKQLELERLQEEEREAEEKKRREKEAKDAVEKYKKDEADRREKAAKQKEEDEREYKRRLQEQLLKSGLDEKYINAIVEGKKIEGDKPKPGERATYTRMPRKHLSIETLRTFKIEYDVDQDPDFVIIKRWVPEWEQKQFWKHTRYIREMRKTVVYKDRHHHHDKEQIELVVRKKERRRSKSPSPLLMYLSGAR